MINNNKYYTNIDNSTSGDGVEAHGFEAEEAIAPIGARDAMVMNVAWEHSKRHSITHKRIILDRKWWLGIRISEQNKQNRREKKQKSHCGEKGNDLTVVTDPENLILMEIKTDGNCPHFVNNMSRPKTFYNEQLAKSATFTSSFLTAYWGERLVKVPLPSIRLSFSPRKDINAYSFVFCIILIKQFPLGFALLALSTSEIISRQSWAFCFLGPRSPSSSPLNIPKYR